MIVNCESAAFTLMTWDGDDGNCQTFPQHSTVLATKNSSHLIYAAYRELGRQYTAQAGDLLRRLSANDANAIADYDRIASVQFGFGLKSKLVDDKTDPPCRTKTTPAGWAKGHTPSGPPGASAD